MSSHHDTSLSALSSTTPTGTDLNDKGIGSGSNTTTGDTTGNTTGNTTNSTTQHEHGNSNMGGPMHGSSTGPAGAAPGYSPSTQHDHAAAEPTKTSGGGLGAGMGKTGENVGQGARDIYKGVHGAGESLRGALNGAVDKAFGSSEGVEKNQSIVQKGVNEMPRR